MIFVAVGDAAAGYTLNTKRSHARALHNENGITEFAFAVSFAVARRSAVVCSGVGDQMRHEMSETNRIIEPIE